MRSEHVDDDIAFMYKNRYFRSETAARWAMFFDAARIPWRKPVMSPPECGGVFYHSDLYLLDSQTWVEVHESDSTVDEQRIIETVMTLPATQAPGAGPALLILGPMPDDTSKAWSWIGLGRAEDQDGEPDIFVASFYFGDPGRGKALRDAFDISTATAVAGRGSWIVPVENCTPSEVESAYRAARSMPCRTGRSTSRVYHRRTAEVENAAEAWNRLYPGAVEAVEAVGPCRHARQEWAAEVAEMRPAGPRVAVYLHFDAEGVLLYIGISDRPITRGKSHAGGSSWVEFASRMEAEWCDSRDAASKREIELIRERKPIFNKQHNDTPEARARLVKYLADRGRYDLLAPAVSRG